MIDFPCLVYPGESQPIKFIQNVSDALIELITALANCIMLIASLVSIGNEDEGACEVHSRR